MVVNQEGRKAFERFIEEFLDNPFKDINERIEKGRTVLHYAAQLSDVGMVRLLIEQGANVNARDDRGETALHIAAFAGKAKNVKALIENGARVNARSNNQAVPLHLACLAGRKGTIEELIKRGGDVEAIDRFECSPLHYAKVYKRVASFLEKKGVNMKEIPEMYDRAKEVIEEIMEKRNVNELKMRN
ncbi:MAG: ankyrin repeat domain-containing protein [Wolbachia sp.]